MFFWTEIVSLSQEVALFTTLVISNKITNLNIQDLILNVHSATNNYISLSLPYALDDMISGFIARGCNLLPFPVNSSQTHW